MWVEYLNTGYWVTKNGDIKNRLGRILKGQDNRGYRLVTIKKDGKYKNIGVHRLVATCFIDNPLNKPHVNHIDGVRNNNIVKNLEWCTPKENVQHAVLVTGSIGGSFGGRVRTYSDETILIVATMLAKKTLTPKEISKITNVSVSTIKKVSGLKTNRKLLIDNGFTLSRLAIIKKKMCTLGHPLVQGKLQRICRICSREAGRKSCTKRRRAAGAKVRNIGGKLARATQARREK